MMDPCDRPTRWAHVALRRARLSHTRLRHVGLLAFGVAACAVTGCVHRGVVMHGDWSIGVNHVPWDECGGCADCGSVGTCQHGCRAGNWGGHGGEYLASRPTVREYESVPTVPRFHPVPTSRVLTDPAMSSPTLAEPLPGPPHADDTGSGDSMNAPMDAPPALPQELGSGRHGAPRGHQQMAGYRRPNQSPTRWAFRNAPPYYPRRR
jgi:hypothetical protein